MAEKLKRCSCAEHEGPNPLPVSEFYTEQKSPDGYGRWCRECFRRAARRSHKANRARDRESSRRWYRADPGRLRGKYRGEVRRSTRANAASRDAATHHGEEWTLAQLETAARDDLSARQAAEILGRTIRAVTAARRRLRARRDEADLDDGGHMDTNALARALTKNLAAAAVGQGGSFDVFSTELDKQMALAAGPLLARPGIVIPADRPDSDEPEPAGED